MDSKLNPRVLRERSFVLRIPNIIHVYCTSSRNIIWYTYRNPWLCIMMDTVLGVGGVGTLQRLLSAVDDRSSTSARKAIKQSRPMFQ